MLNALLTTVKTVAQREIVPRYLKVAHERKVDGSVLTEADTAAQHALTQGLFALNQCPVLGEEMTHQEQHDLWAHSDSGLWVLDPVDGTSNFANGLPYFGVSVGFYQGGRPIMGVVYAPEANELFWAESGKGAFLNGEKLPIKTRAPGNLHHAMAGVDLKRLKPKLAAALAAHPPYSSQRNFGSSALDWCYVAAGRLDIYIHGGQKLWDYAAGALILEQAGGALCTLDQDDFWGADPWQRSVICASDPAIFQQWRDWIRAHQ
jgi:myo-inositol-1(or 4)-monophosphatase